MSDKDNVWGGFEVIYQYTRQQGIEDGVLADLSALVPDVCREIYPDVSVACTSAVWKDIEKAVDNKKCCNDLAGVVHDLLWMSKLELKSAVVQGKMAFPFRCTITGIGFRTLHNFVCALGVADDGTTPAITILYPGED